MATRPEPKDAVAARTAGAQSVELKVAVADKKERAAAEAFDLDPRKGERRRIFFFDTSARNHFEGGLVLRAREVKGGRDDSTVKIRKRAATSRRTPTLPSPSMDMLTATCGSSTCN